MIPHGVDVAAIALGPDAGGYVAFLGRMVPEKGAREAIEVARHAGWPIAKLSGQVPRSREGAEYFDREIAPLLGGGRRVRRRGRSGGEGAASCAGAAALVNPIPWREPFGLVMAESLACGTPVVARAEGAAPEIVGPRHGRLPRPHRRRARGGTPRARTGSTA